MINWGERGDGNAIAISTSVITDAYNEIATWRKNVFLVPYGKEGRDFIDRVTLHINDWNSGSDHQHISLKAAFVLLAVGGKVKLISNYTKVELFKVVSENSRRRNRPIDLRFLLSLYWKAKSTQRCVS